MKFLVKITIILLFASSLNAQKVKFWKPRQEVKFKKKCLKKYAKKNPDLPITKEVEDYCTCLGTKLEALNMKARKAKHTDEIKFIEIADDCYKMNRFTTDTVIKID